MSWGDAKQKNKYIISNMWLATGWFPHKNINAGSVSISWGHGVADVSIGVLLYILKNIIYTITQKR